MVKAFMLIFLSLRLYGQDSPYDLKFDLDKKRTFIFPPLISTILPGFDQYFEKQSNYGFPYTATAVVGVGIQMGFHNYSDYSLDSQNNNARMYQLGGEFYKVAGGLSSYHSFRTAVKSRKEDFPYLTVEETPMDLLLSPIKFSYLSRPTTYLGIPGVLVLNAIIGALIYPEELDNRSSSWHFNVGDLFFSATLSAGAGISEEAFFRGWMMPTTNYYVKTPWVSNLITSILFGAAHLGGDNTFPLPQALAGYYFGWVAQRNDWGIGESIFIHTWVDVIAFLVGYATGPGQNKDHVLYLPINFSF